MTRLLLSLAIAWTVAGGPVSAQAPVSFSGRVYDAATKDGIENLQVKLTPPRQSKAPLRLAQTARDGTFGFEQLARGRYLLEVSLGTTLLYRAEVDAVQTPRVDIPLRRR